MRRIGNYLFRQTMVWSIAILGVLTGIVWVTQALRRFDLVTAKGQALLTYLAMTLLAIPFLVSIVAPFALVFAMVIVLNQMHANSELIAINAAGQSQRRTLGPFLGAGLLASLFVAWIAMWAGPASMQKLRDYTTAVRADVIANVAQPGRFVEIDDDFTFHMRNRVGDGSIRGLFIYDARASDLTYTYTAEQGRFIEALGKTLMVMENGTIERRRADTGASTFVAFGSYAFDLSTLQPEVSDRPYEVDERTFAQLLETPADDPYRVANADRFTAEIHNRLTSWLYPVAMVLAAFYFLGFPRSTRQTRFLAVITALFAACLVRLAGFGAAGVAANSVAAVPLLYLLPLSLITVFAFAIAAGVDPQLSPRLDAIVRSAFERIAGRLRRSPLPGGGAR